MTMVAEKKTGLELIAEAREKQLSRHGFDASHDKKWTSNELVMAAMYFAIPDDVELDSGCDFVEITPKMFFVQSGWNEERYATRHKKSEIECLAIAGALIAAEIDRLMRERAKG